MNEQDYVASVILTFLHFLSLQKILTNNPINKIDPMVVQKHSLDYVEDKHQLLSQNTTSVQQQIAKLR